jgi:hypothetical protein
MNRIAIVIAAAALSLGGCGEAPPACMGLGSSLLVSQAALFRIAVYGGGARCAGSEIAAGAGAPIAAGDFLPGQTIRIDAPSGPRTITLSAFADLAGTQLLGTACQELDLPAGSPICLDLTLVAAVPDGAAPQDGPAAGDASDAGCAGGGGCWGGRICCGGACVNPDNDPNHCGGCSTVCSTVNATPTCSDGHCNWTCSPGFAHCAPGNTGCETATDDSLTSCGGCQACDTVNSLGAACINGACSYVDCAPGRIDCNATAPDSDGCECATPDCCGSACQTTHDNGVGQVFYDCQPKGTHDQTEATAACAAYTGDASLCHVLQCSESRFAVCSDGAADCICWGYGSGGSSGRVNDSGSTTCNCPYGGATWN